MDIEDQMDLILIESLLLLISTKTYQCESENCLCQKGQLHDESTSCSVVVPRCGSFVPIQNSQPFCNYSIASHCELR